jgi:hypothetical protein
MIFPRTILGEPDRIRTYPLRNMLSRLRRATQGLDVHIRAVLETEYGTVFEPDNIAKLTVAFEAALTKLRLVDRKAPHHDRRKPNHSTRQGWRGVIRMSSATAH